MNNLPENIILIRHGISEANLDHSVYDVIPDWQITLHETAYKDLKQTKDKLKTLLETNTVSVLYSPYIRTIQTANYLKESFKHLLSFQEEILLYEQAYRASSLQKIDHEALDHNMETYGKFWYREPGGENLADVYQRCVTWWNHYRLTNNVQPDVLVIVTHGQVIKCLKGLLCNYSSEYIANSPLVDNSAITVLRVNGCNNYIEW